MSCSNRDGGVDVENVKDQLRELTIHALSTEYRQARYGGPGNCGEDGRKADEKMPGLALKNELTEENSIKEEVETGGSHLSRMDAINGSTANGDQREWCGEFCSTGFRSIWPSYVFQQASYAANWSGAAATGRKVNGSIGRWDNTITTWCSTAADCRSSVSTVGVGGSHHFSNSNGETRSGCADVPDTTCGDWTSTGRNVATRDGLITTWCGTTTNWNNLSPTTLNTYNPVYAGINWGIAPGTAADGSWTTAFDNGHGGSVTGGDPRGNLDTADLGGNHFAGANNPFSDNNYWSALGTGSLLESVLFSKGSVKNSTSSVEQVLPVGIPCTEVWGSNVRPKCSSSNIHESDTNNEWEAGGTGTDLLSYIDHDLVGKGLQCDNTSGDVIGHNWQASYIPGNTLNETGNAAIDTEIGDNLVNVGNCVDTLGRQVIHETVDNCTSGSVGALPSIAPGGVTEVFGGKGSFNGDKNTVPSKGNIGDLPVSTAASGNCIESLLDDFEPFGSNSGSAYGRIFGSRGVATNNLEWKNLQNTASRDVQLRSVAVGSVKGSHGIKSRNWRPHDTDKNAIQGAENRVKTESWADCFVTENKVRKPSRRRWGMSEIPPRFLASRASAYKSSRDYAEERPPKQRQPAERPPKQLQPAERPPKQLQPAERPPKQLQPAERPPKQLQPAERPPKQLQAAESSASQSSPDIESKDDPKLLSKEEIIKEFRRIKKIRKAQKFTPQVPGKFFKLQREKLVNFICMSYKEKEWCQFGANCRFVHLHENELRSSSTSPPSSSSSTTTTTSPPSSSSSTTTTTSPPSSSSSTTSPPSSSSSTTSPPSSSSSTSTTSPPSKSSAISPSLSYQLMEAVPASCSLPASPVEKASDPLSTPETCPPLPTLSLSSPILSPLRSEMCLPGVSPVATHNFPTPRKLCQTLDSTPDSPPSSDSALSRELKKMRYFSIGHILFLMPRGSEMMTTEDAIDLNSAETAAKLAAVKKAKKATIRLLARTRMDAAGNTSDASPAAASPPAAASLPAAGGRFALPDARDFATAEEFAWAEECAASCEEELAFAEELPMCAAGEFPSAEEFARSGAGEFTRVGELSHPEELAPSSAGEVAPQNALVDEENNSSGAGAGLDSMDGPAADH